MEGVEELLDLLRARATVQGRMASCLPGLWFFRSDRPTAPHRIRSRTMYVGVALQGKKRVRAHGLDLVYDRLSYFVMRGETDYESTVIAATPERPYLGIGIDLSPRLVMSTLFDLLDGGGAPERGGEPDPAFVAPLDGPLVDAFSRLLRSLDQPAERRVLAPLAVREIVFRLLCSEAATLLRQAAAGDGDGERIRKAMAYIEEYAERPLSVAAVARHVAMSPSHFAHRFRDVASVSPMRYLKYVRLERARALLIADGLPIGEVADRVGYQAASHFTRDFKRHYGLAPGKYLSAFERGSTVPTPAALSQF